MTDMVVRFLWVFFFSLVPPYFNQRVIQIPDLGTPDRKILRNTLFLVGELGGITCKQKVCGDKVGSQWKN